MKNTILVATAGGAADKTAEYVVGIAAALKAKLVALHIVEVSDEDDSNEVLERFRSHGKRKDIDVVTTKRTGDVVQNIIDSAREYDAAVIVMGASQGMVLSKWLSADVFEQSTIPVVVIPHHWMDDE